MSEKTEALEVINKDQAELIDQSKALLAAHGTAEKSSHVYLFALGARLRSLKEACPHGQFEKLKAEYFSDKAKRTLQLALTFSDAVNYFAKGKYATVAYLGQGELQLSNGVLSEKDCNKAAGELEQITKGKGINDTIKSYFKKTAPKPPPVDAVEKEKRHQDAIEQSFRDAQIALDWVLHWKDADYVLASKGARATLAGACVRYGKRQRAIARAQKLAKTKTGK